MPPSTKRSVRARRETINNTEVPDSSPSRPSKRRKKVSLSGQPVVRIATNTLQEAPVKPEPEPEPDMEPINLPLDQSGIDMEDDDLVVAVTRALHVPTHHVKAIDDNSDRIHERHGAAGVQAYAKLSGKGWTYYIKKLINVIGRPPEGTTEGDAEHINDIDHGTLPTATEPERGVHVNLGPNKMVSRSHAEISFDSNSEKWNVLVHGRNGIKVNGFPLRRGESKELSSGQILEIGAVEMMFVMPNENEPLVVHKKFLQRAGLILEDPEKTDEEDIEDPSSGMGSSAIRGHRGTPGGLPIAPAPHDYRRPGTPSSVRSRVNYTTGKSPYVGGTIVMNAEDIDLSIDENRHIKPTFSYAQLITQAILNGPEEKSTLAGIYRYITDRFAYYRFQPAGGWQVN